MIGSRQRELLRAIVEEYVKTARPVGSKSLCKKFKCSSATIRNDMAALEDLGYLEKTHISSGRVPSENGYRYYVDNLMEPRKISGEDMLKLQTIFNNNELALSDAISKSLEIISDMTNYTSVILGKESSDNKLQRVEVVPITSRQLIAIVITDKGHVENKNINLEENIPVEEISKTTELLNKMLIGTPIDEVPSKLEFEIKPIINQYVKQHEAIYNAFYDVFNDFVMRSDVSFVGRTKILNQPEFNNVEKIKKIFTKLDDDTLLNTIEEDDKDINIYIGNESHLDEDVTVIKTKYKTGDDEGVIAIIGPKRMEYAKVVSLLNYIKENLDKK